MTTYKGVSVDDKDIVYVKLPNGIYLVDGEIVNVDSWSYRRVQCKNPDDIRIVNENRYIKEYRYGEEILSAQEYEEQRAKLAAECIIATSNDDDDIVYKDLDSEFKFRRFISQWKPIYATEQTISEPIKVEIEHILYDTGNEFIWSAFLSGNSKINEDDTLYTYNQSGAWLQIVKDCFDELGMEYRDNVNYSGTSNKKIWSNSRYSCIEFVVAFGTYLFNNYKNPCIRTGTLDDMKERYEKDKEGIRNIIIQKYHQHFGNIKAGMFDFERLLNTLKTCSTNLHAVSSTTKTKNCYYTACRNIKDAIDQIEAAYYEG